MNKVGHLIKYQRNKLGIKQINLAKGICTPSYLSKIEKNNIEPSDEILILLLDRLNMSKEDLINNGTKEKDLLDKMKSMYYETVINRKKPELPSEVNFMSNKIQDFYTFKLMLCRMYLSLSDSDKIQRILDYFSNIPLHTLNDYNKYMLYKNKGINSYQRQTVNESVNNLETAMEYKKSISIKEWEDADFYYTLSLAYLANYQNVNSIIFCQKALNYFKDNLIFARTIDCYLTIGIALKRSFQYEEALRSFATAQKIVDSVNLNEYRGIISQNKGSLYSLMGDSKKALENFEESLKNKRETTGKIISIFSMIKENSKLKISNVVIDLCNQAKDLILNVNDKSLYFTYLYQIEVYKSLHEKINFEEVSLNAIRYFENVSDYKNIYKYHLLLAENYMKLSKYKLAAISFQKSNEAYKNLKGIKHWEDLQ